MYHKKAAFPHFKARLFFFPEVARDSVRNSEVKRSSRVSSIVFEDTMEPNIE